MSIFRKFRLRKQQGQSINNPVDGILTAFKNNQASTNAPKGSLGDALYPDSAPMKRLFPAQAVAKNDES
jgi:hypothetical protein